MTDSICNSPTTGGGLATTGGGDAALQATESGRCPVHICASRQASAMSSRRAKMDMTAFAAHLRLEVGWLPQEAEMLHCKQPNQADAQSTCASDRHLRSVRKTKWTDSICSSPTTGGGLATTGGGDAALQATESGRCAVIMCIGQTFAICSED